MTEHLDMSSEHHDLDDVKKALRKTASQTRKKAFDLWPNAAAMITDHAAQIYDHFQPRIVAAYWPIRTEIDPIPLQTKLVSLGASLGASSCLPATPAEGLPLTFYLWQEGMALHDGPYGTKEPFSDAPIMMPDLILAPLLAYDKACWRLGYGGGFYDRTLAALEAQGKQASVIGIAFDESEVASVPTGPYDRQLDGILTPTGLRLPQEMP